MARQERQSASATNDAQPAAPSTPDTQREDSSSAAPATAGGRRWRVKALRDAGYFKAGRRWAAKPVEVKESELTPEQVTSLLSAPEALLEVREIKPKD